MSPLASALTFAIGSLAALACSWRSLRHPGSHGVPRLGAFECILGILVLNLSAWFAEPLAPRQLLSWFLLAASALLAVAGFVVLRTRGGPARAPADSPLHDFEATSNLVTTGPYRWIRHPLYAALVYLAWGAALKTASWVSLGLALIASGFLLATARIEERENLSRFGPPYQTYMQRTTRFIPGVL